MSRDYCVTLSRGAMGVSAFWDCGISWSYSLTIFNVCLQGLQNMTEDIKIIAVLQHSHLLGRGVTTRHFRNGVELEPLMDDPNYDFNFQSFRPLKKERIMKPVKYCNVCVFLAILGFSM